MARVIGTARADLLRGTFNDDRIFGLGGGDMIYGERDIEARDRDVDLRGAADKINGGGGNDVLYGDGIAFSARGGASLTGGSDVISGGRGHDTILGDGYSGTTRGGADTLFGGRGEDWIVGDGGATVSIDNGNAGAVLLTGGDDVIFGGGGRDFLYGDGDVIGEDGDGTLTGGADTIHGGRGEDLILGDGFVEVNGDAVLVGGDDRLFGGAGHDMIVGDGGGWGSTLTIQGGDDRIVGGAGDDTLVGDNDSAGQDEFMALVGGADTFVFCLGDGRDTIHDFRSDDGDVIELHGYRWGQLDSNGDGVLTGSDARVSDGVIWPDGFSGEGTTINLDGGDALVLTDVFGLVQNDFIFV